MKIHSRKLRDSLLTEGFSKSVIIYAFHRTQSVHFIRSIQTERIWFTKKFPPKIWEKNPNFNSVKLSMCFEVKMLKQINKGAII